MTKYELARDKKVTIAALVLEVFTLLSFVLLADSILGNQFGIQTMLSNHVSWKAAVVIVLICQYALITIELIARNREEHREFTIPLVFIPFGHIIRAVILFALDAVVVAVKLIVYFLSVLLEFIFMICRVDKYIGTSHIVDMFDRRLEIVEKFVNATYNHLFFVKIQSNGNIFNSVFNSCLTLWCINH